MRRFFLNFIGMAFIASSCVIEDPETVGDFVIINNSGHELRLKNYVDGELVDTLFFKDGDEEFYSFSDQGYTPSPPYFMADSSEIVFDDTVSIMHYRDAGQGAANSILISNSWSGGKTGTHRYEFEYIFDSTDYHAALDNK